MILIDQSVGSRDLVKYVPLNDPSLACLTNLSISSDTKSSVDIAFCGNGPEGKIQIGIEFKHIGEFLSAIHSGRFQATQVQMMVNEYDICWLLLCGEYRCGDDGFLEIPSEYSFLSWKNEKDNKKKWYWYVKGIPYQGPYDTKEEAISAYNNNWSRTWKRYEFIGNKPIPFGYLESALHSLSRAGIQHKHFYRIEDCAQWIGVTYRSWQKEWNKHHLFRTFDKSTDMKARAMILDVDPDLEQKLAFARGFPGIDFERAMAVAQYFESPRDMFTATADEWAKIPGIGKVISKVAFEVANHKSKSKDKRQESKSNPKPRSKSKSKFTDPDANLDIFS